MHNAALERLRSKLTALDLSGSDMLMLTQDLNLLEKELIKQEFKISRTLKDKEIAINLLNASVSDLEKSNRELSLKNDEIGHKNEALNHQKQLLEASRQKLEEKLRELQQSYEALEQFSYIASHDLKTPLRSIASYAQLLQRRYVDQLDKDASEFLDFIVAGAKHMNDIICDVLEYSRTSMKNQPKTPIDFNAVLQKVLENLATEIKETRAEIVVAPMPFVLAHESGMVQLFQNLLSNALKFSGENRPRIEINAEKRDNAWFFSIADSGIGIDPSFSHKIFLPFQRLQANLPGLGMGLAVCKKIVQSHHGEIWVVPNEGGGSVFKFTIPDKSTM